jgi:hypothetical protein
MCSQERTAIICAVGAGSRYRMQWRATGSAGSPWPFDMVPPPGKGIGYIDPRLR